MKRSRGGGPAGRLPLPILGGLTALEATSRLTVPASVLLLSGGATSAAALTSAVALIATVGRGFASSFAIERSLRATFASVIDAALRLGVSDLRAERKLGLLADAAREAAAFEATVVPQLAAHLLAVAATWIALGIAVGPLWALAAFLAAGALVLALALGARRIRAEQQAAWDVFGELAIELRVLVEACAELRAHDREPSFAEGLLARAAAFARAERRASVWSAASASLASAIVLLAATTPLGDRVASLVATSTGRRAAEIGILAGAALYFAAGFGKLLEHRARFAPFRDALARFLAAPELSRAPAPGDTTRAVTAEPASRGATAGAAPLPPLATATVTFRDLSCRHPGAPRETPSRVSRAWPPGRGLVLTGDNGAGKSTLVLALLGLIAPSAGAIEIDGAPLDVYTSRALRRRVAYLAQAPFVEPGASIAWHLRLFAAAPIDDAAIDDALRRAGLLRVLAERAGEGKSAAHARDVLAGELSGGERQRMHIARLLAHEADLLILDEPEAGLDRESRVEMARLFEDLARDRRVLLIAHDPAIIPASFDRLPLRAAHDASPRPAPTVEHERGGA